jgi:hypothetical protein
MSPEFLDALKWIGLVLAAGFIGYFGRYLAMWIIEKVRRKEKTPPGQPAADTPLSPEKQLEETRLKVEKKKAKAEAKKIKKEGR